MRVRKPELTKNPDKISGSDYMAINDLFHMACAIAPITSAFDTFTVIFLL